MLESETARVSWARGMALLLPLSLDAWGESPANWHPVVWFGRLIRRLERSAPGGRGAESLYGGTMLLLTAPCALLPAWLLQRLALRLARELARRDHPMAGLALLELLEGADHAFLACLSPQSIPTAERS